MTIRRALLAGALGAIAVLGLTPSAAAQCTVSATSVAFGGYDVFSAAPVDSAGSVTFRCTPPARDVTITLDRGGAPSFGARRMLRGGEPLRYNLYLDAARTRIWGDGTGGTQVFFRKNAPPNSDVEVPIYGRIPAGQDVSVGTYANAITVTILF